MKPGKHRQDLQIDIVVELRDDCHEGGVLKLEPLIVGAHPGVAVVRTLTAASVVLACATPLSLTITPPPWLRRVIRNVVKKVCSRLA